MKWSWTLASHSTKEYQGSNTREVCTSSLIFIFIPLLWNKTGYVLESSGSSVSLFYMIHIFHIFSLLSVYKVRGVGIAVH